MSRWGLTIDDTRDQEKDAWESAYQTLLADPKIEELADWQANAVNFGSAEGASKRAIFYELNDGSDRKIVVFEKGGSSWSIGELDSKELLYHHLLYKGFLDYGGSLHIKIPILYKDHGNYITEYVECGARTLAKLSLPFNDPYAVGQFVAFCIYHAGIKPEDCETCVDVNGYSYFFDFGGCEPINPSEERERVIITYSQIFLNYHESALPGRKTIDSQEEYDSQREGYLSGIFSIVTDPDAQQRIRVATENLYNAGSDEGFMFAEGGYRSDADYRQKYQKYKTKYLELKQKYM
jgi:hypothetical protein